MKKNKCDGIRRNKMKKNKCDGIRRNKMKKKSKCDGIRRNKMKKNSKKYYTVGKIPKANRQIVERGISETRTHKY